MKIAMELPMISIYLIQATLETYKMIFKPKDEYVKGLFLGTGIVKDPMKFNRSNSKTKPKKGTLVLILKATKGIISIYPKIFQNACKVTVKLKIIEDETVTIPGVDNLEWDVFIIQFGLKMGDDYKSLRKQWTQKSPSNL
jgi:hypothetical protein